MGPRLAQSRKEGPRDAAVVAAIARNVLTHSLDVVVGTEVDLPRVA
ncbi:hypothetical protein [Myxococcus eversor]|nr:hypothetical protein [Myxococcus eversor]